MKDEDFLVAMDTEQKLDSASLFKGFDLMHLRVRCTTSIDLQLFSFVNDKTIKRK